MVDIKRVTALVTKNNLYTSQSTSLNNTFINFNPSAADPDLFVIDPFALFTQEGGKFRVKIPFTRFYRVKYSLPINDVISAFNPTPGDSQVNPLIFNSYNAFSIAPNLIRTSQGVDTDLDYGVFKQQGEATYTFKLGGSPTFLHTTFKSFSAAVVEGIVELYAGDELTFKHTLSIANLTIPNPIEIILRSIGPGGDYEADLFGVIGTSTNPFSASYGFFFEISELTDL